MLILEAHRIAQQIWCTDIFASTSPNNNLGSLYVSIDLWVLATLDYYNFCLVIWFFLLHCLQNMLYVLKIQGIVLDQKLIYCLFQQKALWLVYLIVTPTSLWFLISFYFFNLMCWSGFDVILEEELFNKLPCQNWFPPDFQNQWRLR